jgi:hypothetical protein
LAQAPRRDLGDRPLGSAGSIDLVHRIDDDLPGQREGSLQGDELPTIAKLLDFFIACAPRSTTISTASFPNVDRPRKIAAAIEANGKALAQPLYDGSLKRFFCGPHYCSPVATSTEEIRHD